MSRSGERGADGCFWPVGAGTPLPEGNDHLVSPTVFSKVFSVEECETLRAISSSRLAQRNSLQVPVEDYRFAETWYLDFAEVPWAFERLAAIASKANQRYRLDVTGIFERLLLVRYTVGGHFNWHADTGIDVLSRRKISLSVQLSDPATYEGGALEFSGLGEASMSRGVGTTVAFPAFFSHRVTPIAVGERWSLVGWVHGPAFR